MVCKKAGSSFLLRPVLQRSSCHVGPGSSGSSILFGEAQPRPELPSDHLLGATAWAEGDERCVAPECRATSFIKGGTRSGFGVSFGSADRSTRKHVAVNQVTKHKEPTALQCDTQRRADRKGKVNEARNDQVEHTRQIRRDFVTTS